jgi:hypothetical protein
VLHLDAGTPCIVGDEVTIGHSERQLTVEERRASRENAARYVRNAALYMQESRIESDERLGRDG